MLLNHHVRAVSLRLLLGKFLPSDGASPAGNRPRVGVPVIQLVEYCWSLHPWDATWPLQGRVAVTGILVAAGNELLL